MTSLFRLHQLLRDVALHDLMQEISPHRLATSRVNLKALLQRQPAAFKTNVHETGAGEVGVSENSFHPRSLRILPRQGELYKANCLHRRIVSHKHRKRTVG